MQGRNRELDTQPTVSGDEQFSYLSNWTTIPENLKLTVVKSHVMAAI